MLENIIKKFKTKITAAALAGALLLNSACVNYQNFILPDSIRSVESSEKYQSYDYKGMTWEEAIKSVKTPEQVFDYLQQMIIYVNENDSINKGEYQSFKLNHSDGKGVCVDYAIAAAALLSDNGYPPLLLYLMGKKENHTVFLFKQNNSYYALGNTPSFEYNATIEGMIKHISSSSGMKWDNYFIVDLEKEYPDREWIDGDVFRNKCIFFKNLAPIKVPPVSP